MGRMRRFKTVSRYLLGILFIAAGVNHFVMTDFYISMMPPYLPWHLELVYVSGVAEAGVRALLLFRRWAVWGGWGVIAVCVAVFPANVQMALHAELFPQVPAFLLALRLQIQIVLLAIIWWSTKPVSTTSRH